jgi:hypothetical protein
MLGEHLYKRLNLCSVNGSKYHCFADYSKVKSGYLLNIVKKINKVVTMLQK